MTDLPKGEPCPNCGKPMLFVYGNSIDYDAWVCIEIRKDGMLCDGEIELNTSTNMDDEND